MPPGSTSEAHSSDASPQLPLGEFGRQLGAQGADASPSDDSSAPVRPDWSHVDASSARPDLAVQVEDGEHSETGPARAAGRGRSR